MHDNQSLLRGLTIVVTRPRAQSRGIREELLKEGARVILFPTIAIKSLKKTRFITTLINRVRINPSVYDWIVFLSENGVRSFVPLLNSIKIRSRICAVGPQTARVIRDVNWPVHLVAKEFSWKGVVKSLRLRPGHRVLIPRVKGGSLEGIDRLRKTGVRVDVLPVYQNVLPSPPSPQVKTQLRTGVDVIFFTSASSVKNLIRLLPLGLSKWLLKTALVLSIGPHTTRTLRKVGARAILQAKEATTSSMLNTLKRRLSL